MIKQYRFLFINLIFIFIISTSGPDFIIANDSISDNYRPPLDIPLLVSGNFGDIRSSSFHFGMDFRTNDKTGYPVYSIADGYIARIKVEPGGYGRAVYINHPNGITSVYAHLESLNDSLSKFIKAQQYLSESFYQDLYFKPDQFPVIQCDLIGFSGNAGQSSGPHLHFELRETFTQNPINSLVYSFPIIDSTYPILKNILIYEFSDFWDGTTSKMRHELKYEKGKYRPEKDSIIYLPHFARIGLEMFDNITDRVRKLAFCSVKMYIDSILYFNFNYDEMQFEQVSYVNSFIDFEEKESDNLNIHNLFQYPNQELKALKYAENKGIINFEDSSVHEIRIIVTDASGNLSELYFKAKCDNRLAKVSLSDGTSGTYLSCLKQNIIENKHYKILFPANSLFNNICINVKMETNSKSKYLTNILSIGNPGIPIKKTFSISIPYKLKDPNEKKKILIAKINSNGLLSSIGGTYEKDAITANAKSLGKYVVTIDTIAPKITPQNISRGKNMANETSIRIRIQDELSGISEYKGFIDGKWVLFEYDLKNHLLTYKFDNENFNNSLKPHKLSLKVTDKCNNTSYLKITFTK